MRKKREIYDDLPPRSDPNYMKLYKEKHKDRLKEHSKQYYKQKVAENPDFWKEKYQEKDKPLRPKYKKRMRESRWRYSGIKDFTHDLYESELVLQEGKCKICGNIMEKPHVDHDHATGKYRGLLCSPCNTGLGIYEKNKEKFQQYLENFSVLQQSP